VDRAEKKIWKGKKEKKGTDRRGQTGKSGNMKIEEQE
jgi:hypothetical protein